MPIDNRDHYDVNALPLGLIGRSDSATACHTCVFYSRPEVASRVLPFVEPALRSHRSAVGFQIYLWPFDVLGGSPFSERARACTEVADVVVIATDDNEELPASFRGWLEEWQHRRSGRHDRLVALFHARSPEEEAVPAVFENIVDFAVASGIGFIWCGMPDEAATA